MNLFKSGLASPNKIIDAYNDTMGDRDWETNRPYGFYLSDFTSTVSPNGAFSSLPEQLHHNTS